MSATKSQSLQVFSKLKNRPGNKVRRLLANHRNLGVHISFVRSTNLDQWTWDQLRLMKVGGNEAATIYFKANGGSAALASKDVKSKYTSAAAVKYKEELKRRADQDAEECALSHPPLTPQRHT
ncbi:ADP-ribosylation factor GTPase activating protein, ER-Golgi transport [Ascosphaera acerosa]|nr:ADP-ribosylation factor GTPase activating protein, ER-Golgi transport [Ascosphaera acerosa]